MTDDPFKRRPEDVVNQAIRSGVGALPILGDVIKDWIPYVIGDPAQERRDDFMRQLGGRVIALEEHHAEFSPETLRDNEKFNAAVIEAAQGSLRTASAEKKRMLQNAVLNTVLWDIDETRRHIFMQHIDRMTPLHVQLLDFLDNPRKSDAAIANRPWQEEWTQSLKRRCRRSPRIVNCSMPCEGAVR